LKEEETKIVERKTYFARHLHRTAFGAVQASSLLTGLEITPGDPMVERYMIVLY
jgi:hypothetical protein